MKHSTRLFALRAFPLFPQIPMHLEVQPELRTHFKVFGKLDRHGCTNCGRGEHIWLSCVTSKIDLNDNRKFQHRMDLARSRQKQYAIGH